MTKKIGAFLAVFLAVFLIFPPLTSSALTVLQLNLEQLTALSEKVFVGRCVAVRPDIDSAGRNVHYVTFEVSEMLKGEPAKKITWKQIGEADGVGGGVIGGMTIQGMMREMPQYEVGKEAVVFLSGESRLGFTSPVGFSQGKFDVETSPSGSKSIHNGLDNRGLFLGWKKSPKFKSLNLSASEQELLSRPSASGSKGLPLDHFVSLVKKLAE